MPLDSAKLEATKASAAATKIQANFRGYRVRKRLKEMEGREERQRRAIGEKEEEEEEEDDERAESTTRKESNGRRGSLEEKSAIKIQARVRGFLVRKRQQTAQLAATKIQAGFRGFKIRKLLKQNEH